MLYLFDKNENLIDELASNEIESLIQHEELNKLMTLEFAVFIDSNDKMKNIEYVAHKDMEDYGKIQMYRVISSESDDYTVNYQAVHIIFDELKSYGYIRDKRPDKVKASVALNIAIAGSRWKVGRVDDSELLSTNFYDCTRLDALSKIIKTWNLDLHFYLTFDGNKITGRYIDLLGFRGEDTGERFVYGSNALEVIKEVDVSEVYTRVIPRGKGEEKLDEEGKPTDGYGRRIKIDDVVWEKSKGNPIDKPKGQEYLELKEMTNKFGFSDGEARTRVQIFEDIEDPKELIKAGYDFLVKVSRPLVQFKTKISKRSRTNVGDIVRIIRKDLDFYYRTRIYKANRNLLNETLEVEFGDKLVQSPADREKIVSDSLNSLEERIKETETDLKSSFVDKVNEGITHATFNRDGYNYELKKGNKYGLPAGYYSFDREIEDNPQRVIYVGAGTLAIADSKKSNGDWNFRTFGTGQGFVADLLVAGTILGGKVRWNLEDGTLLIGNSPDDYNLYWDGETLNLRNTKIDFRYDKNFIELKNNIDKKISKEDILEDKEIQEALKGKDGPLGEKGKDGQDGKPGKDGKSGRLGKNLLLDSFREAEGIKDFLIDYDYAEQIEADEELTLTVKIDKALEESASLSAYNGKDTKLGELIQSEKDKTKYVLTFNYLESKDDTKKLYIYLTNPTEKTYTIKWAVLARGDVEALDWYRAEEDMQKQIDSKASEESLQDLQVHFAMYPTAEELNQNKVDLIKQQAYLDQLKTAIDSNALSLEERL
ncbi:MAG: phage tail spike protein, partial [Anaerococcus vaginalis]